MSRAGALTATLTSVPRKQPYLDAETAGSLERLARRTGRSEAAHVREALSRYLRDEARASADPLERLIGLVDEAAGPDDMAANHDHYLYAAPKERG